MKKVLVIVLVFAFVYSNAQQTSSFKDPRDGKTYKTVEIGDQIWMAENLAYNTGTSYAFDDKLYGRVYNYETAKDVCPSGWHLPSSDEWISATGGRLNGSFISSGEKEFPVQLLSGNEKLYYKGSDIKRAKEYMRKKYGQDLYNTSGLALVPSSFYNMSSGKFKAHYEDLGTGTGGVYWTNTKSTYHYDDGGIYAISFSTNNNKIKRAAWDIEKYALSVRCVKD